jgi:predicted 3-demethylubiquinone-9 3-methyltransferase (glyoxalase superfamily)
MKATPYLMFQGQGSAAIDFYRSNLPDTDVVALERYHAGEPGAEGTIKSAMLRIDGLLVHCTDSVVTHAFSYTPSFSLFVDCESESELRARPHHAAPGPDERGSYEDSVS